MTARLLARTASLSFMTVLGMGSLGVEDAWSQSQDATYVADTNENTKTRKIRPAATSARAGGRAAPQTQAQGATDVYEPGQITVYGIRTPQAWWEVQHFLLHLFTCLIKIRWMKQLTLFPVSVRQTPEAVGMSGH